MSSRRIPTQQDIQDAGRCGDGYRPSDGQHCGQPSESAEFFSSCTVHAQEWREMCARIDAEQARIDAMGES